MSLATLLIPLLMQEDAPDLQKRIIGCFRNISRLFSDSAKCEENLNMLHQLKDADIWKIFTSLLNCSTTFEKAWSLRVPSDPSFCCFSLHLFHQLLHMSEMLAS